MTPFPVFASITHNTFVYHLGSIEISGFGLAVLMAFAIAQIVCQRELWRRGYDPTIVGDAIFAAVLGGLLGAKLYYVILMGDINALFSRAGFVFWGGLIGGLLAVTGFLAIRRYNIARIFDISAPGLAAAYSIGRIGCWAVGDDYGRPWNGPWAVSFPEGAPPSTVQNMTQLFGITDFAPGLQLSDVLAVHPTQLYEVALGFIMFVILWKLRDHKHAEGWLFGVWAILAGVERFIIEFFRAKDDRFFEPFTTAQIISLAFIVIGIVVMYMRRNVTEKSPGIYAKGVSRI